MRTVIQRVRRASVTVDGALIGAIEQGLLVLVGVGPNDTDSVARWLANRIAVLRIFSDDAGKFNRSLLYVDVSQRRPSFVKAAPAQLAEPLIARFIEHLHAAGIAQVETGRFGAVMLVTLENDGPVTILLNREDAEARE